MYLWLIELLNWRQLTPYSFVGARLLLLGCEHGLSLGWFQLRDDLFYLFERSVDTFDADPTEGRLPIR